MKPVREIYKFRHVVACETRHIRSAIMCCFIEWVQPTFNAV